jgi:hypothetical protein
MKEEGKNEDCAEERDKGSRRYKEKHEARRCTRHFLPLILSFFFLITHRGSCSTRRETGKSLYVFGKGIQHFYMHQKPETKGA